MSRATLEERVADLEKQVDALRVNRVKTRGKKNWRRSRGAFTDDVFMKQVFAEGRKIRSADRKRSRVRTVKKRPTHP